MNRLITTRTISRPFLAEDAEFAFHWFSDPEVMRFIPFGPDATLDQTSRRISRYMDHQKNHGFSKWLVLDRDSELPVGDAGFVFLPDGKRPELGYRLARSHWGRGLATEIAAKWLSVADDWFGFREVYAFAHPENTASLHVLEKLEFSYIQPERLYEMDAPLYQRLIASQH